MTQKRDRETESERDGDRETDRQTDRRTERERLSFGILPDNIIFIVKKKKKKKYCIRLEKGRKAPNSKYPRKTKHTVRNTAVNCVLDFLRFFFLS